MHLAQEAVNAAFVAQGLDPFGLGIGLFTGEVAAALLGSADRVESPLVGDTANLAQRLQQWAVAGETVLSGPTMAALVTQVPVRRAESPARPAHRADGSPAGPGHRRLGGVPRPAIPPRRRRAAPPGQVARVCRCSGGRHDPGLRFGLRRPRRGRRQRRDHAQRPDLATCHGYRHPALPALRHRHRHQQDSGLRRTGRLHHRCVYAGIVVGFGRLLPFGENNPGLAIAATALVAAAFEPVRVRVQHWANRLVYGKRATPYEALAAMTASMGDSADPSAAVAEAACLLAEGTGAAQAVVWVAQGGMLTARATAGEGGAEPVAMPLRDAELPALAAAGRRRQHCRPQAGRGAGRPGSPAAGQHPAALAVDRTARRAPRVTPADAHRPGPGPARPRTRPARRRSAGAGRAEGQAGAGAHDRRQGGRRRAG